MLKPDFTGLVPYLDFQNVVNPPRLPDNDKIALLVDTVLSKKTVSQKQANPPAILWNEARFGLGASSYFREASSEQKQAVLSLLTKHFLAEACHIEKSGIAYAGKMILLSETIEEKSLYAIFGLDEAVHLKELENYIDFDPRISLAKNPFLHLIAEVVRLGSPEVCQSLVQVVLEGYGMNYYSFLKDHCIDPGFKNVLQRILKEEAAHHGSGVVFSLKAQFSPASVATFNEMFRSFAQIFQCWAFPLLTALEAVLGHLSLEQKRQILSDVGMEQITAGKLVELKALLETGKLLRWLDPMQMALLERPFGVETIAQLHGQQAQPVGI
jgi:hypothetical protein